MFGVILLPDFSLQAVLRHHPEIRGEPVAILGDDPAANAAIFQCNAPARAAGVQVGMTSSQGLARCGHLHLVPRSLVQEAAAAEALLESAFVCSPWVESTAEGVCTFERRGTLLEERTRGDENIVEHLARLDLASQVGIAENPDLALLAAHAANPCLVVADSRAFLSTLPVSALSPSPQTLAILKKWGIETLGALSALPADAVTQRLGPEGRDLWERAAGRKRRLLQLASPRQTYEETMEFEFEVQTLEPLLFVLRRFIEQLVLRLAAIYRVPEAMALCLRFDDGQEHRRQFRIPAPTGNVETLFRVVHTHLENFVGPSPVRSLHLAATPALATSEQFGLFGTALRDPNRFSETLARLHALLGPDGAGVVCRDDTHRPDAFHLQAPDFLHLDDATANKTTAPPSPPTFGLPLRRWRPPWPLQVDVRNRFPTWIRSVAFSGEVRAVRGPYQLTGGWWERQSQWACEEWDVELANGSLYRLSRQRDDWFLEGTYD